MPAVGGQVPGGSPLLCLIAYFGPVLRLIIDANRTMINYLSQVDRTVIGLNHNLY
jgi:hypothetical protein